MEVGGGSCAVCSDIQRLPEECVSRVISLTSPRDACRLEAVSAAFRSAAVSDDVWKSFLPYYAEILARAVDPMEFASIKQLYFRLCNPILIDDGKMGFFVDRDTGSKCFILSARELGIAWAVDTPQHWRWIQHPESMFSEVAELRNVCWLEIRGRINSKMLSKWSNYSAYLLFKLSNNASGFKYPLQEASVAMGAHVSKFSVRLMEKQDSSFRFRPILGRPRSWRSLLRRANLSQEPLEELSDEDLSDEWDEPQYNQQPNLHLQEPLEELSDEDLSDEWDEPQYDQQPNLHVHAQDRSQGDLETVGKPQTRKDGWMEILLGEFYNEEGDDGEIVMSFLEVKGGDWKSGLIVHGIEIRPKN